MTKSIIIAGFGGQGILSMGRILASAGMMEGKTVSWLPSYGPEMRGGTANCNVIISDEEIGSPILNTCDVLIAMNGPSLDKFEKFVEPNGIIIADESLVHRKPKRSDVCFFTIPAVKLANEMGGSFFAGIIILGKLIKECEIVSVDSFEKGLRYALPESKHYMIPDEMKALKTGMEL
jgi:2-oxoglutarate ferredoxin oxidoreductase subunit gamma